MTAAKHRGVVSTHPDPNIFAEGEVLRRSLESAPIGIAFTRGPEHALEFANAEFVRLAGRTEVALIGRPFKSALPDTGVTATAMLDGVYETGRAASTVDHERRLRGKPVRYLRCTAWPQSEHGARVPGLAVVVQDITPQATERRNLEERSRTQRSITERMVLTTMRELDHVDHAERQVAQFGALLGSLSEGVLVIDAQGNVLVFNAAAKEIYGVAGAATIGDFKVETRWLDGTPMLPEDRPSARALRGQPTESVECLMTLPDGRELRLVVKATSVPGVEGDATLALIVVRDVTALRQAELLRSEAFEQSEALRALGQMAAGIAHDIANLLNPISLNTELITRALEAHDTERQQRALADSRAILERAFDTLESLRDFAARRRVMPSEPVDLVALAREATRIARPRMAIGRLSRVVEDFTETRLVRGQSSDIVRALVNLECNAIDALRSGGVITLRSGTEGDGAWIEVGDNGPGMAEDVRRHAFEPFFTTKGKHGTGMGLAMVKDCVDRHHGRLTVESSPGHGTRVKLWFPANGKGGWSADA